MSGVLDSAAVASASVCPGCVTAPLRRPLSNHQPARPVALCFRSAGTNKKADLYLGCPFCEHLRVWSRKMDARFAATLSERESIRSDTRVVAGRRWKSPGAMRLDHFQESFRPANLVASCRDWPGQQPGVEFCPFRARLGCENDLRKTAPCRTTFGARHAFARRGFSHCI